MVTQDRSDVDEVLAACLGLPVAGLDDTAANPNDRVPPSDGVRIVTYLAAAFLSLNLFMADYTVAGAVAVLPALYALWSYLAEMDPLNVFGFKWANRIEWHACHCCHRVSLPGRLAQDDPLNFWNLPGRPGYEMLHRRHYIAPSTSSASSVSRNSFVSPACTTVDEL